MSACIFCRIVAREIPADIVHENDHVLAFRDLRPVAPSHVLVIPKRHIDSVREAETDDVELLGHVMIGARGLTRYAAGNRATIIRRTGAGPGGATTTIPVRLSDLLRDGDISQDIALVPGDTLVIPQGWF